jgi:glycosyltransferase involved in cell wall biosynthesis
VIFGGKTHRNLYRGLLQEVRSFRPDVLLVNSEPEGFLAMQAALVREAVSRKPALVFTTWRNMAYGRGDEPFPVRWPWLSKVIENFVLPRAAWGIGLSPSAPGVFRAQGYSLVSYIPPWVDERRFTGERAAASGPLAVGYVGRLVREKGVDLVLRALAKAPWPFTLTITGNGPERGALEELARSLGIADRCSFRPSVPAREIPGVMRAMDILVLPSRSRKGWKEQFGRVVIEAMAAGTVVVGSDNGDIPAVIGDAGLIFHEDDVDALFRALDGLHSDAGLLKRLQDGGRKRVRMEFSLGQAVARHAGLLATLAREHAGS